MGCGKLKHLEVRWLWLQELVTRKQVKLQKVSSELNGSDLATKYLPGPRMKALLALLGFTLVESGTAARTSSAVSILGTAARGRR